MVLEELEHAKSRGAKKFTPKSQGFGMSGDAYHMTAPSEGERGCIMHAKCIN